MKKTAICIFGSIALVACAAGTDDVTAHTTQSADGIDVSLTRTNVATEVAHLSWARGTGTFTAAGTRGSITSPELTPHQAEDLARELWAKRSHAPHDGYVECSTYMDLEDDDNSFQPCDTFEVYGAKCMACVTVDSDCSTTLIINCAQVQ